MPLPPPPPPRPIPYPTILDVDIPVIFEPIPLNEVANNVPVTVAPMLRVSIFLFPPSWYKATEPFLVANIAC